MTRCAMWLYANLCYDVCIGRPTDVILTLAISTVAVVATAANTTVIALVIALVIVQT
jgi:hypothetical protein